MLLYRANDSVKYTSALYSATETVDHRYAGSTTVDMRNTAKRALWGTFDDFQAFTSDVRHRSRAATRARVCARGRWALAVAHDERSRRDSTQPKPAAERTARILAGPSESSVQDRNHLTLGCPDSELEACMGNFSRDSFDPAKAYIGVRLQQGVPVLDADWNELNDVIRQELYDTFSLTFTDGIQPGGFDLEVLGRPEPNDFHILAGAALCKDDRFAYERTCATRPNRGRTRSGLRATAWQSFLR